MNQFKSCMSTDVAREYQCPQVLAGHKPVRYVGQAQNACMGPQTGGKAPASAPASGAAVAAYQSYINYADPRRPVLLTDLIAPGYYPDMTQPHIGRQAVFTRRPLESHIPATLKVEKNDLLDRQFDCYQPKWDPKCL
jgi:hypothetical protein